MTATMSSFGEPTLVGPLGWLCEAKECCRSTLVVGLALLSLQEGVASSQYYVTVSNIARWASVSRRSVQRALAELEGLELISVARPAGWELLITLIDPDPAYEL